MNNVEYKLLFLLPIFPQTESVLLLDIKPMSLITRLLEAGIRVCHARLGRDGRIGTGTSFNPSGPGESSPRESDLDSVAGQVFDIVVAGNLPAGQSAIAPLAEEIQSILAESGHLVAVLSNKYGYSRLRKALKPASSSGPGMHSLRGGLSVLKQLGFNHTDVFSPMPNLENPAVFVSLRESNSLEFLLVQFEDFARKKSWLIDTATRIMIRMNIYKHLLNQYVIVARRVQ
jgi:hypothetical protein